MGIGDIKKALSPENMKQIQESGEQFMRYWKSVDEDLKAQTAAINENFAKFMDLFNSNMDQLSVEITKLEEKIEKVKNYVTRSRGKAKGEEDRQEEED